MTVATARYTNVIIIDCLQASPIHNFRSSRKLPSGNSDDGVFEALNEENRIFSTREVWLARLNVRRLQRLRSFLIASTSFSDLNSKHVFFLLYHNIFIIIL